MLSTNQWRETNGMKVLRMTDALTSSILYPPLALIRHFLLLIFTSPKSPLSLPSIRPVGAIPARNSLVTIGWFPPFRCNYM